MNSSAIANLYPAPSPRFVDNGDGTITDNVLRLMWSKATLCDEEINQHEATRICSELRLGEHSDWRLPNDHELLSLVDRSRHNPAIDTDAFPDTKSDWYWTSTEYKPDSSRAWIVYFYNGSADYYHRDCDLAFVRAVRSLPAGQ